MQEYIDLDRLLPSINKKCSELSFALESDHYSLGDTLQSVEDSKAERSPFILKDDWKEENPHPFSELCATVCKSDHELKMALSAGNPNINISTIVHKYGINANLETQAESEKYGFSLVTKIQCLTKVLNLKNISFSPEALQLIDKKNWETFYNRYGDYHVSQVFKGSLLKLTIKVASSSKNIDVDDFVNFSTTGTTGKAPIFPVSLKGYLHKLSQKYSLDYSMERIGGPSFEGSGPTPEGVHPTTIPETPSLPTIPTGPGIPEPHGSHPVVPTPTPSTPPSGTPPSGTATTPASTPAISNSGSSSNTATSNIPSDSTATTATSSIATANSDTPAITSTPANINNNNNNPKPVETRTGVLDKEKGQKEMESLLEYCTKFCVNTNESNEANIRAVFTSYRIPGLSQELFPKKKNYDDVCEEVYDYMTVQYALMNAKSTITVTEKALEADDFLLQINQTIRSLKGIYDTIGPWGCQPLTTVREHLKAELKERYKTPRDWGILINKFLLDWKFNGLKNKNSFCLKYIGTNKDDKGERLYLGSCCPKGFEFWELDKQIQHRDDRWAPTLRYDDEINLSIHLVGEPGNEIKFIENGNQVYISSTEACLGQHNYLSSNGIWDDDRQANESKWTIHTVGEKKEIQFGDVITIANHKKEFLSSGKNIHGVHKLDLSSKAHYWKVCKPRTLPRDHSKV